MTDVITGWPDHHIINGDPASCGCPEHRHLMGNDVTPPLAFIDTETTGLNPEQHQVWELAVIKRLPGGPDVETVFQFTPDLALADERALEVGRFHDRFKVPPSYRAAVMGTNNAAYPVDLSMATGELNRMLRGAVLVGSNTAFDASFMRKLLRGAPWHYRVVNALELAAGSLLARGEQVEMPWTSAYISMRVGVEPPDVDTAHTALGDARWARDVFDRVVSTNAVEDAIRPVYRERAQLLALLSHQSTEPVAITEAPDVSGWWLLGLSVAHKVCTWHISPEDLELFSHVERVGPDDPRVRWDGHTTADKYRWIDHVVTPPQ